MPILLLQKKEKYEGVSGNSQIILNTSLLCKNLGNYELNITVYYLMIKSWHLGVEIIEFTCCQWESLYTVE